MSSCKRVTIDRPFRTYAFCQRQAANGRPYELHGYAVDLDEHKTPSYLLTTFTGLPARNASTLSTAISISLALASLVAQEM